MLFPVKLAGIDDNPADRRTVASDKLGGRIHDNRRAMIDGAAQHRCGGVVHNQRDAKLVTNIGDFPDRKDLKFRVWQGFGVIGARFVIRQTPEVFRVRWICKANFDTHLFECIGKKVPSTAVKVCGTYNIVTRLGDIENGKG